MFGLCVSPTPHQAGSRLNASGPGERRHRVPPCCSCGSGHRDPSWSPNPHSRLAIQHCPPWKWHGREINSGRVTSIRMVGLSQVFISARLTFFSKEFCCSRLRKYFYLMAGALFGRFFFFSIRSNTLNVSEHCV